MNFHRILGALFSVVLIVVGVGLLALAVFFRASPLLVLLCAPIGALCATWGADMAHRAATGAVTAASFFDGRVGAFRAVAGLVACAGLVGVGLLIVFLDLTGQAPDTGDGDRLAVVALIGFTAPAALVCARALRKRATSTTT